MSGIEWVTIIPGGDAGQAARDLLSLAEDPNLVRTNTDHGLTFLVPSAVAERYTALLTEVTADPTPVAPPVRRRGGRPRKENP